MIILKKKGKNFVPNVKLAKSKFSVVSGRGSCLMNIDCKL